ncbi:hypothetical protein MKY14_16315 [Paenibacillus sp. FSL R5-0887]|uniref:hypothetical protein n=1 Tax=Paenibacillus sp. FSL R5-0887 TaxID=2921662 RepID=UPI0030F5A05F
MSVKKEKEVPDFEIPDVLPKEELPQESGDVKERIAPLIYLGPNLPGGLLSGNTVFKGGKPAHIEELITAQPELSDLIVPVDNINETLSRINRAGTAEYQAYQALKEAK